MNPSKLNAHHVQEYDNDHGETHIDNGALLCPHHHTLIHHSDYRMRMLKGRPQLLVPAALGGTGEWIPLGKSRLERTRKLKAYKRMGQAP